MCDAPCVGGMPGTDKRRDPGAPNRQEDKKGAASGRTLSWWHVGDSRRERLSLLKGRMAPVLTRAAVLSTRNTTCFVVGSSSCTVLLGRMTAGHLGAGRRRLRGEWVRCGGWQGGGAGRPR